MNLLISAARLADVAFSAARAVRADQGRRIAVPNCCRLTANGNLSIYGTDLGTAITAIADCNVVEPGEAIVDAHKLAAIARKLVGGDVLIEKKAEELVIKKGGSRFTLKTLPVEDYPLALAVEADARAIDLTAADVMAIFDGAAAGAATDSARIYLAGPHIFGEPTDFGQRLCGIGADGVALSYAATAAGCSDLGQGVIVHRDTCKLVVGLFGKTGASLRLSNRLIEVASDGVRLVAKLVDSVPSAWRSFVPPIEATNVAVVASDDLQTTLERCFAIINNLVGDLAKRAPSITLRWDAAAGPEVRVAFRDITTAPAALDVVPAKELSGKADISVDPKLLLRLLEGFDAENVRLSASGRSAPLRIDAGPDRFAVLSPMRDFSHVFEEDAA